MFLRRDLSGTSVDFGSSFVFQIGIYFTQLMNMDHVIEILGFSNLKKKKKRRASLFFDNNNYYLFVISYLFVF